MSYYNIKDFKAGLDTRRDMLASIPGTLQTLQNCHITQGGEIEKRLAFVRTALPASTFGLERVDTGLVTFGSVDGTASINAALVTVSATIGQTITYQRLQHPSGNSAMTEVVASRNFQGNALVLAKYADGRTFLFYNGTIVLQSAAGVVPSGFANQTAINVYIAQQIATQFGLQSGWAALYGATGLDWPNVTGDANYYSVKSPDLIDFTISYNNVTAAGKMRDESQGSVIATAGVASAVTVVITGVGGDTFSMHAPAYVGDTTGIWLTAAAGVTVPYNATDNQTATDIRAAINARTAIHSFVATGATNNVIVSAPIPESDFATAYNQGSITYLKNAAPTVTAFTAGVTSVHAWGQLTYGLVDGAWLAGDTWQLTVDPKTGDTFIIGRGNINDVTSASGTNIFVDRQRAFLANGRRWNFSAINDPTGWEDYNTGAGFLPFTSQYGVEDSVVAFATYQNNTAVFGRRSIQIWSTPADIDDFAIQTTLNNIGTIAKLSVESLGTAETLFLADTGIRSLRIKDVDLNAFVEDIGSPIDLLLAPILASVSASVKAAACAIVEPTQNRYWLYIGGATAADGVIYVLSYFPTNKIVAWSTYKPTYNGDVSFFTPQKFVVSANQVFVRTSDAILAFGGSTGVVYDACTGTVITPFQSGGGGTDKPATNKVARGINTVMRQAWIMSCSTDWVSSTFEEVYAASQPTYDGGFIPYQSEGTHFAFKATTVAAAAAKISSLVYHFNESNEES